MTADDKLLDQFSIVDRRWGLAILRTLEEMGSTVRAKDAKTALRVRYGDQLPAATWEWIEETRRVDWTRYRLTEHGLLSGEQRGSWTLTEKGRRALAEFCGVLLSQMATAGPRRDHQPVDGDLEFVRGAVRWGAPAQQAASVTVPCRYWERTLDTDLNRLFAAAIDTASGKALLAAAGGHVLVQLRRAFAMVPRTYSAVVADVTRPLRRMDAAFEPARALAIALLTGLGRGHGGTDHAVAFSVNVERLFERTVETALSTQAWDVPPRFQAPPPYLADGGPGNSRLDALVKLDGQLVVVDAKYAQAASKGHLYQVLAYMKMLGARLGVLVYPSGAQLDARRYRGQSGGDPWTVLAVEVDPVLIAHGGRAAVAACGAMLRAFISEEVVDSTPSTPASL